jgi:hypothetical protein
MATVISNLITDEFRLRTVVSGEFTEFDEQSELGRKFDNGEPETNSTAAMISRWLCSRKRFAQIFRAGKVAIMNKAKMSPPIVAC